MKTKTIEALKELSHLIQENKDELYNIDTRGEILDKIQSVYSEDVVHYTTQTLISDEEHKFFESVRKVLNILIHDLMINNQNPDIGLKMCSDIGLILAIYDE